MLFNQDLDLNVKYKAMQTSFEAKNAEVKMEGLNTINWQVSVVYFKYGDKGEPEVKTFGDFESV